MHNAYCVEGVDCAEETSERVGRTSLAAGVAIIRSERRAAPSRSRALHAALERQLRVSAVRARLGKRHAEGVVPPDGVRDAPREARGGARRRRAGAL